MTTHNPSPGSQALTSPFVAGDYPLRRTTACPPLPALREALLRESWSIVDKSHVESCEFCRRNLRQASAQLWHPSLSAICRIDRSSLSAQDRQEVEFHLHEDGCSACSELDSLWRASDALGALATAAIARQDAGMDAGGNWSEFAQAALQMHPASTALRDRLTAIASEVKKPVEGKPSLVTHVERLLADLARGDAFAGESLVALAWSRIVQLSGRVRKTSSMGIDPQVVEAAAGRLRRALRVTPQSAREFFRVAAQQIRQELLSLAGGQEFASGNTVAAAGDLTTVEVDQPSRWRDMCLHLESGELSDEEREVVELLWLHGLTAEDAAALIGAEPRIVRRRWRSALLNLHDATD